MKKKTDPNENDDYKLTLVYHKVIYCKKKEMASYESEAKKNKLYKYSMPEKLTEVK